MGLAFVHEQGLELEIWDRGACPRWAAGVRRADHEDGTPGEMVRIPQASHWLMVLPTYVCTTRPTRLPANHPPEIAAMLEFELPRIVPSPSQSWTWDYSVVGEREDGTSQLLVFLSPLSVVEAALKQVRAVGIEPRRVTVRAALHAARLAHTKGVEGSGPCGYVWWEGDSLDFFLMEGRSLAFLRGVRVCGSDSQGLDFVELEVGRSLSLLARPDVWPAALPLCVGGTNPGVPCLIERLKQRAGVEIRDGAAREPSGMDPVAADAVRHRHWRNGHVPADCVNLLPQPLKERGHRTYRRRQILAHGLRTCLVILLLLVCLRASLWRMTQVLRTYEQRLVEIAPLAQKLQFLQNQLRMIRTQVQGSVSMLDILGQLYQLLPPDATIHYLSIDQDGQVVIRAQAKRLSQAFDCIDPLERSEYLANVRQNYAHLREIEGQILIDFELRADLEKPGIQEAGT